VVYIDLHAAGVNLCGLSIPALHDYQAADFTAQSAHGFTTKEEFEVRGRHGTIKTQLTSHRENVSDISKPLLLGPCSIAMSCPPPSIARNFQLAYNLLGPPTLAQLSPSETASLSSGTRRSSVRLLQIKSEFTVRRTSPEPIQ
jgi:hypothetical protein